MQSNNPAYTLGLDIGMASVGAALLSGSDERIVALHVRTFDKAEVPKTGESLNKQRRDARSARRRLRRRAFRLLRLARLMRRRGLIAEATHDSFFLPGVSPWDLRAAGLDRLLTEKEWATVIYHLVKHRGFHSNRKSEAKEDAKVGEMLTGAGANSRRIDPDVKRRRTAGEMVATDPFFAEAKRNKGGDYSHTLLRTDLERELALLFDRQRSFNAPCADVEFEGAIHTLLMERRPTLAGDELRKMVGKCVFEPDEFRAPKAGYRAQRFVWLQKLNNLKIVGPRGGRSLTDDERYRVMELPFVMAKLTFKQLRDKIDIEADETFNLCRNGSGKKGKGGDKNPEDSTFFEAKDYHALRKAYEGAGLHDEWRRDSCDPDRLDTLAEALTVYKEDDAARAWLAEGGVEEAVIEAALGISFTQFIHVSQKALAGILPFLEKGRRYDEAAADAGYNHSQPKGENAKSTYLPPPDRTSITNPVVRRALNQARKLVNAVIRRYGPPMAVHIELARDLSRPHDERRDIKTAQDAFQSEKKELCDSFVGLFGVGPKKDDLLKYRLFRQQLDQCPYCQSPLAVERLREPGYAQVDHILPYSRSYDDSMNNKVVVHTRCNQNKGNLTPYEYLGGDGDTPAWRNFVAWVTGMKNIRKPKRDRLLRVHFGREEASGFRERHLNDTRYICREFKRMVETHLQWHPDSDPDNRCVVVSGRLTAFLRTRWGVLKEREKGDLHHALDAAVVAAASRSLVKRLADHARRKEVETLRDCVDPETGEVLDEKALQQAEERFPDPWPHFRRELLGRLSANPAAILEGVPGYEGGEYPLPIRVSRPPQRRGTGEAHKGTIRSRIDERESSAKTPLEDLKLKDLDNIVGGDRDKKLVEAIRERLERYDGDGKKAFGKGTEPLRKPSRDPARAPIIRSVKLRNPSQNSGIPVRQGIADNGGMLRVDIFRKGKKFYGVPVYVHHATQKELPDRAVVIGKVEADWERMDENCEFLFSLHPGDWVRLTLKKEVREGYYGGFDRANAAINIWTHDRNRNVGTDGLIRAGFKTAVGIEKFHVDMLGKLYPASKERRRPLRRAGNGM